MTYTSLRSFPEGAGALMASSNPSVWLKSQAASARRRGLSALHHPGTLLPLLQLVVLKQALITRDAVSSVREGQQAWRRRDKRDCGDKSQRDTLIGKVSCFFPSEKRDLP